MNDYEKMKRAERLDEDCDGLEDEALEDAQKFESEADRFKRVYKDFYTDIKISHREDW